VGKTLGKSSFILDSASWKGTLTIAELVKVWASREGKQLKDWETG
jgi:hypothetical protein